MGCWRIATGPDGWATLREIPPEELPAAPSAMAASRVFFKEFAAGTDLGWHPAPRRMLVVLVEGELELEFRDGTVRRFVPGDVRLMEDTGGKGHRTRVVGPSAAVVMVVALE